jgi:hypothetical protein
MRKFVSAKSFLSALVMYLLMTGTATAQEGHPLKGSWIGEWSGNSTHGDFVLLVMDWDGKNVTGVINPGTDDMVIESVTLNPSDWTVTIRAAGYELQGRIQELELPSRSIVGTWKNGNRNGKLEISRQ